MKHSDLEFSKKDFFSDGKYDPFWLKCEHFIPKWSHLAENLQNFTPKIIPESLEPLLPSSKLKRTLLIGIIR